MCVGGCCCSGVVIVLLERGEVALEGVWFVCLFVCVLGVCVCCSPLKVMCAGCFEAGVSGPPLSCFRASVL